MKAWLNGQVVEGCDAKISVLDHGLLYGDGVFEGIRIINRRVFRLDDHLKRLETSAKAIGLVLPLSLEKLQDIVLITARAFDQSDAYIRLLATRGEGELGVDPTSCSQPQIICIIDQIRLFPADKLMRGIDMITSSWRRPAADVLDPRVKSLNYLNNVMAKQEARQRGADEALLLNHQGMVTEASVANIFTVLDGVLTTPPINDGALAGITRTSILECADTLGIQARQSSLTRYDILQADEVFVSGTGARMVPVATLDGQTIGHTQERPITAHLADALHSYSQTHGVAF